MGKVYVFLATGFEEIEAIATIDVLRRAGIKTVTCSLSDDKDKRVVGAHGITVTADFMFGDSDFLEADALVLPGGMPGTLNLKENNRLRRLIIEQHRKGKLLAAICAAPSILGELGLLKDVEAVCYPSFEDQLTGAKLSKNKVVQDGKIITGNGPGVAIEFGLKIVEALKGSEEAEAVSKAIHPDAF